MSQKIGPPTLEEAKSLQHLINSGTAWMFPASYGRAAIEAIRDGKNLLPSLLPGKIGSPEYVAAKMGEDYLNALKEVAQ